MKKLLLSLLCACGVAMAAQAQSATPATILVLDVGTVFNQYKEAIIAAQKFQSLVEEAQGTINTLLQQANELDKQAKQLDVYANDLSSTVAARDQFKAQRDAKIAELQRQLKDIDVFKQSIDQTLNTKRAAILQIQFGAIRDAVKDIATKRGATLVLNTAGVNVVYAQPSMDITEEVVTNLNAAPPSTSASSALSGLGSLAPSGATGTSTAPAGPTAPAGGSNLNLTAPPLSPAPSTRPAGGTTAPAGTAR